MRRRQFILAGLSAAVITQTAACGSGRAVAPPPSRGFTDTFDSVNDDRWTPGAPHTLGRTEIHPENVTIADGQLRLALPGQRLSGAELRTVATLPTGTSRARIKVADCPDSVTGFFLYAPPDYAHEVDIELYNRPAGHARLTTYDGGKLTRTAELDLPFDPTADFHDYAIALAADAVEFYADGQLLTAWSGGVPSEPMNLYLNAWYPAWLGGTSTPVDTAVWVDSVSFTSR